LHRSASCVVSILLLCLIVGCERTPVTTAPATAPATDPTAAVPASAHPTTDPASTQPRESVMTIDGRRVVFPPARLVLKTRSGQVHATLHSDDPPAAIRDDYTGNSYYLEMPLDVDSPEQLAETKWTFKAPSSERSDTVSGVYLDGRKQHLQPFDVAAEFEQQPSGPVKVYLTGQFLLFGAEDDPTAPGQIVLVDAELEAAVVRK
jgi:hypothetical protein